MASDILSRNKTIVKEYIEQVVNTGNVDQIGSYIAPDYVEIHDGRKHALGIQGAIDHVKGVRQTYPDLKLEIDHQIAEGDWVATSYTMTGTHKGDWAGTRPSGKKIKVTGVNLNRLMNGKIVEHGGAANLLQPLLETGAVIVPEQNGAG